MDGDHYSVLEGIACGGGARSPWLPQGVLEGAKNMGKGEKETLVC